MGSIEAAGNPLRSWEFDVDLKFESRSFWTSLYTLTKSMPFFPASVNPPMVLFKWVGPKKLPGSGTKYLTDEAVEFLFRTTKNLGLKQM